jgi:outer membrane protein, heavy metal efflux system
MIRKIFIIFLVGAFLVSHGFLYADEALSLTSLIREAKEKSPEILAAKKRWEAALARVPMAKTPDDPKLGFTFEKMPGSPVRFDRAMSEDKMLSVSQMFPFFGKLPLKGKVALVESQMAAEEYKNKELELIAEVKNAYYDLFMNYKEVELNETALQLLVAIAKIAEAKYAVGKLGQEELFKINTEIADLSNAIFNLKQEQSAKKTRINALLSRDPESPLGIPEVAEEAAFNKDTHSLYKLTLENQPELLIFSYAIEKNKYAKSLAKRNFFPDLMAQVVMRGFTTGNIGPWDLMLAFTVPLWFWTKQRYEVKEAIANLEEAQAAYKAMENKALSGTKDLAVKIEIAKNKINLYKTNLLPILESSIDSSLAAFRSGNGDLMALLDSERMLIETKMNYYRAIVEYNMNLADLERITGTDLKGAQ